jgi:hypothetical protein
MQRLPDVTSVVVRTPLIPQSASAADPRLLYGRPTVADTSGLTPAYLPNQLGSSVNMPYSSATGPMEASNGQIGEGIGMSEPPTGSPTSWAPTSLPSQQQQQPRYVLLPAPIEPTPLWRNSTLWSASCVALLLALVSLLLFKASGGRPGPTS